MQSKNSFSKKLFFLIIVLLNIGCDQVSKNIAREKLNEYEEIKFLNNHFTLTKIENTGAFLSLGENLPEVWKTIILNALPILAIGAGLYFLLIRTFVSNLLAIGICFIIGGGIGNVYDRLIYGSVTDFLHFDFYLFQTGIFNIADVSIMIGMGAIGLHLYKNENALNKSSS